MSLSIQLSRLKIAIWSDKRNHLMSELINAMRVVKMYCWEKPFSDIINTLRRYGLCNEFVHRSHKVAKKTLLNKERRYRHLYLLLFTFSRQREEMKRSVISGIVEMFSSGLYVWSAKLIAMCTVIAYVSDGQELSPQKAFKLIAWLEVVRYSFYYAVHRSIIYLSQAYFSAQRIEVQTPPNLQLWSRCVFCKCS